MLAEARFTEAKFHRWTGYRTSSCTEGALVTAQKTKTGVSEAGRREQQATC
jgi:hypothetical protein